MTNENPASATARRNRIIAIAAGAITVVAIVVAFRRILRCPGSGCARASRLLLLAELVGLVVLERHQLFEPVHENVGAVRTRVEEIRALITENAQVRGR
jgi:hypothetical protein